MINSTNERTKFNILTAILIFVILFSSLFLSAGVLGARAETINEYSNVLEDLQADENFNESDYPAGNTDKSLYIIQIAESTANELFIYIYQPYTGTYYDLTATSINISTGTGSSLKYANYSLTLLSSSATLHKYVVNGLTVNSDNSQRYYNISSLYRAYNSELDGSTTSSNTTSETAIQVAQEWAAVTNSDGSVTYTMVEDEVVVVTDKYVGSIDYYDSGGPFNMTYTTSHFIAFSTDHDIDNLYEADVYFITQTYSYTKNSLFTVKISEDVEYGEEIENTVTLTYTDSVTHTGSGIFAKTYSWDRIQSTSKFISSESLTDTEIKNVQDKDYVLRFYESAFTQTLATYAGYKYTSYSSTVVSDVTILRLKFETDGVVYNLGVVDSKTTYVGGSSDGTSSTFWDWVKSLFNTDVSGLDAVILVIEWIIIIIILCLVIWGIVTIFPIIKVIVSLFIKILCAPFKAINNALKKKKDNTKDS